MNPDRLARSIRTVASIGILIIGFLGFLILVIPFLDGRIWTWHDEVWNWTELARKGLWVSATYYPAANNHIFLTILQSIWPSSYISAWPPLLRVWGIVLQALLVLGSAWRLERRFGWSGRCLYSGLVFLGLICIPGMIDWTFFARGYPIATASYLLFIVELSRSRPLVAVLVLASVLSVYTLPTMALPIGLAGAFAFLHQVLTRHQRAANRIFLAGITAGGIIIFLYLPVLDQLLQAAQHLSLMVREENPPLVRQFLGLLFQPINFAIFVTITIAIAAESMQRLQWSMLVTLFLALLLGLILFDILADLGVIGRLFFRNAHYVFPAILSIAVLAIVALSHRLPWISLSLSLVILILVGSNLVFWGLPHWRSMQGKPATAVQVRDVLAERRAAFVGIECTWFSEPSCLLISSHFGLPYNRREDETDGRCAEKIETIILRLANRQNQVYCDP